MQAHERSTEKDPGGVPHSGQGHAERKPFDMRVLGGLLVNLDPDAFIFDMSIAAGDIRAAAKGQVRKPSTSAVSR